MKMKFDQTDRLCIDNCCINVVVAHKFSTTIDELELCESYSPSLPDTRTENVHTKNITFQTWLHFHPKQSYLQSNQM